MHGISAGHLLVLRAVADGKVFATPAGFEVDGNTADGDLKRCLDVLWLNDLVDGELDFSDETSLVVLTGAGKTMMTQYERTRA